MTAGAVVGLAVGDGAEVGAGAGAEVGAGAVGFVVGAGAGWAQPMTTARTTTRQITADMTRVLLFLHISMYLLYFIC